MKRALFFPVWLVLEALAVVLLLLLWIVSPFVNRRRWRRGTGAPVMLLHGWGMTRGSMWIMGIRLARAGHGPVQAVGYAWWRPLDRAAARVGRAAAELAAAHDAPSVDVVAHSLGGLVALRARELGAPIGRIVTLGTPHRGAWVGRLPVGPMAAPMRCGASGSCGTGDAAIAGRLDFVIPWRTATLDPPAVSHVLDGVGHGGLLLDGRAAAIVARSLA